MTALLLAWLLACPPLSGPDRAAAAAYADGRFREAYTLYVELLASPGVSRGSVLYDLGNCAFREERFAEAVRCYRSALRYRPRDRALRFNLRLAEERLGLHHLAPPSLLCSFREGFGRLTAWEWLLLGVLLQATGLLARLLCFRRGLRSAAVIVLLLGLFAAGRGVQVRFFPGPPEAVILEHEAGLHAGPLRTLPVTARVRGGDTVRILEASDRWARVEGAGREGWIDCSTLGPEWWGRMAPRPAGGGH